MAGGAVRMPRTATAWIAILTAIVSVLVEVLGYREAAAVAMGFIPDRWSGAVLLAPAVPSVLTPLSATLVHSGLLHLLLNLIVFVWCGSAVERVLGPGPLILIYGVAAFAAAAAQWAVDPFGQVPMVGASGAISGVIGAFALSFGQQKRLVASESLNRMLNAAWLLAAWVVLQLMMGLLAGMQGVLLATPAHVGGFLAGLALQRPLLLSRYRDA